MLKFLMNEWIPIFAAWGLFSMVVFLVFALNGGLMQCNL